MREQHQTRRRGCVLMALRMTLVKLVVRCVNEYSERTESCLSAFVPKQLINYYVHDFAFFWFLPARWSHVGVDLPTLCAHHRDLGMPRVIVRADSGAWTDRVIH